MLLKAAKVHITAVRILLNFLRLPSSNTISLWSPTVDVYTEGGWVFFIILYLINSWLYYNHYHFCSKLLIVSPIPDYSSSKTVGYVIISVQKIILKWQALLLHLESDSKYRLIDGDDLGVLQQSWNRADLSLWRMHESSHVQGYPGRKLTSFFLLLWQCSTTQRIVFSCMFMLHATQLGQWRCGWRTSRSGPCHCQPNLQTWIPLKTSGMWSTGRWMVTSHQTKPSCLNFCARSGIKSPNVNVKDWWRACQDAWKLWL